MSRRGNNELEMRNETKPRRVAPQPKESDSVSSQTEQNIARHFNKSELPNDEDDGDGDDDYDRNFRLMLMLMLAKYPHRAPANQQLAASSRKS